MTPLGHGASMAREATRQLGGDWHGSYGMAPAPGHSPKDRWLKIAGHRSEPGEVVPTPFAPRDDWRAIKDELRERGLLPEWQDRGGVRPLAQKEASISKSSRADDRREQKHIEIVQRIAAETVPVVGTAADLYLQNRGLTPPFPKDIRFYPSLWTMCHDGKSIRSAAMLTLLRRAPGDPVTAMRRTFLTADGIKNQGVAAIKKMLGPVQGGAAWPDQFGDVLALAEGIETALSSQKLRHIPCAAALAAGFLRQLVPTGVREIVIAADRDTGGVGQLAAVNAVRMLWRPDRVVRVWLPITGKDFNDQLRGSAS